VIFLTHTVVVLIELVEMSKMEKMENMLRRFHLMKEPRESEARQQLKRELFAFNKVLTYSLSTCLLER